MEKQILWNPNLENQSDVLESGFVAETGDAYLIGYSGAAPSREQCYFC